MRGSSVPPPEAADQFGVFTAAQAGAAGYSTYRIRRLVRDRRWVVVLGSVYAEASTNLSQASLARAARLAAGTSSVVSHTTAVRLWNVAAPSDPEVHVTVPREVHLRIAGLRAHRVPVTEPELSIRDGILCTSLVRTIVDCLLWLPEEAGRSVAVDVLRQRLMTPDELRKGLVAAGRRHGLARAWSVFHDVSSGAHSEAEVRCHRLFRSAGISGWSANVPVEDGVGLVGYVDVAFDDVPLVVEIDGRAYHESDDRFERDRARQNRLVRAGYTVLRFTWADLVARPHDVVAQTRETRDVLRRHHNEAEPRTA